MIKVAAVGSQQPSTSEAMERSGIAILLSIASLIAFRASPPFFFASDEMSYAEFSNILEIINHAHAILGSVPFIQIVPPDAREAITAETVLDFGLSHLFTVPDSARELSF